MSEPTTAAPAAVAGAGDFVSFIEMIEAHAGARPQAVALADDLRETTWSALAARVHAIAAALMRAGVRPGDRVAFLAHPSVDYAEALFGALAARACAVPLAVSAIPATLDTLLDDSGAKFLFVDAEAAAGAPAVVQRFGASHPGALAHLGEGFAVAAPGGHESLPRCEPGDAFNIIYSSGTTGVPKGIVHLHGMRSPQARRPGFGFSPASFTLLATPMYSNTTITPLLGTLAFGGTTFLMRKFDAGRYLHLAAARRATHTMLVPVQYRRILAHADFDASDLSAFITKQCTGAPMDAALKREILDRWPGRFVEVYGLTEGGCTCVLDAAAHPDKLATVGRPAPGNEVFLIDDAGRRLPPGATGEVVGRSPFMMTGYHNRPDKDAEIRWHDDQGRVHHRTGDIGRFDADGFLTLLDRKKDVIISGGQNIYAADLEAVLATHPDVEEAAVIGIPSERWGETPLALVVARAGAAADAAALADWVNARVGRMQRLAAVEWRASLPRNALGKISKKELRAPYWTAATASAA